MRMRSKVCSIFCKVRATIAYRYARAKVIEVLAIEMEKANEELAKVSRVQLPLARGMKLQKADNL